MKYEVRIAFFVCYAEPFALLRILLSSSNKALLKCVNLGRPQQQIITTRKMCIVLQ